MVPWLLSVGHTFALVVPGWPLSIVFSHVCRCLVLCLRLFLQSLAIVSLAFSVLFFFLSLPPKRCITTSNVPNAWGALVDSDVDALIGGKYRRGVLRALRQWQRSSSAGAHGVGPRLADGTASHVRSLLPNGDPRKTNGTSPRPQIVRRAEGERSTAGALAPSVCCRFFLSGAATQKFSRISDWSIFRPQSRLGLKAIRASHEVGRTVVPE